MAKFATLYSGSSGNSTLVRSGGTCLLVDMGCSCKRTLGALYELGCAARDLDGILVTHEHTDHVSGLLTFLKHYPTPVYGAARTLDYLRCRGLVPPAARLVPVECGVPVRVGEIVFSSFGTSHDSVDCVGYRFAVGERHIAVATDLGYVSDDVLAALRGCELVALESNYDEKRLQYGPYPPYLKNRIRSLTGHLSNADCASCAAQLAQEGMRTLVLMHLSQENNEPELAQVSCLSALENCGVSAQQCEVFVAPRHSVGKVFEV